MKTVSVVSPCYNEEESIGKCINEALKIPDCDVTVVDNGSTDRSKQIISKSEVIFLIEDKRGYGNAYKKGIDSTPGDLIIFIDGDCSYDNKDIPRIIEELSCLENPQLPLGSTVFAAEPEDI